ncbi:hypothetical protein JF732_18830 [Mycobacterium intracellulare]|uniref:Uncharacterized protein n=1 Tax=Mycobacterium intracellulare TaxID=1767 RepID=A0AAE4RDK3_MYCIT|nr:hypothetical protein [Mycobacterium intracellulare]MCA2320707.1 hypothetical protein [Mycobacterium intracellulare]MCA2342597.1 hypothetical protein [Mycobacterium intracellulare]MDV6978184.1 hypothetical protein [Mycobacterium intracellulare]MDV6983615.1 hypothetical protein [Mycobacterium intracellulare]MDV7013690.1 hypothetical protein [Mycobacterium intracellulare]
MTVLDESPAVHVPAAVSFEDLFGVRLPGLSAGPATVAEARPTHRDLDREEREDGMAAKRSRYADRRMQRAREQLPTVEAIRRLTVALCDRPYCLSSDEMSTLGDVFVYNDAHGS